MSRAECLVGKQSVGDERGVHRGFEPAAIIVRPKILRHKAIAGFRPFLERLAVDARTVQSAIGADAAVLGDFDQPEQRNLGRFCRSVSTSSKLAERVSVLDASPVQRRSSGARRLPTPR